MKSHWTDLRAPAFHDRAQGILRSQTNLILVVLAAIVTGLLGCDSSHEVSLTWNPSTSAVVGYNVYRGTKSGGPYTKLNSSPVVATSYTDRTVQSGQTYFYVVTAIDSKNVESALSREVSAEIPANTLRFSLKAIRKQA